MANAIERWKAVLGAFKNAAMTQPSDANAIKRAKSFVRQYEGAWNSFLQKKDHVINPDNQEDIFDIGTMDEADPPVFTAAGSGKVDKFVCAAARISVRKYVRAIVTADELKNAVAVAGDAGKTPEEIKERIKGDTDSSLDSDMGGEADDEGTDD